MGFFEDRRREKEIKKEIEKEEKLYRERYAYLSTISDKIDICINYLVNKRGLNWCGTYTFNNYYDFSWVKDKDKIIRYTIHTYESHACGSDFIYDTIDLYEQKNGKFDFNNNYYGRLVDAINIIANEYRKLKKYDDERERNCNRLIAWYERVEDSEFVYNLKNEYKKDPENFFYKQMGLLKGKFLFISKSNQNCNNNISFEFVEVLDDSDDYIQKHYDSVIVTYCGKTLYSPSTSYITFLDNLESFNIGWYKEYKKLYKASKENSSCRRRTKNN